MKAILRSRYGSPEVLRFTELDKPQPGADDLLIRVYATTVNRTDCALLSGAPWVIRLFSGLFRPKIPVTGTDFAGVVDAIGHKVITFKPGDEIWGFDDTGLPSHAEYMVVSSAKPMILKPSGVSFETAVASAEGVHYGVNFINKVKLQPGQKALVYGASGAIGSALVQILQYEGLSVTAVCGTAQIEHVASLNPDKLIDYQTTDFTEDEIRYDYVFDAVGKSTFGVCKVLLKKQGIYISSEPGPWWQNLFFAILTPMFGGKKVIFPVPFKIIVSLRYISKLLATKQFRPLIDRIYPLEQVPEAFTYVRSGQKLGNVVIRIFHEGEEKT